MALGRLHRILRIFARRRHLGLSIRSFSKYGSVKRTKPGQFFALVYECTHLGYFSIDGRLVGRISVRLLLSHDGPAVLRGFVCIPGDQRLHAGGNAEGNGKRLGRQIFPYMAKFGPPVGPGLEVGGGPCITGCGALTVGIVRSCPLRLSGR